MQERKYLPFKITFWFMFIATATYFIGGEIFLPTEWDTKAYEFNTFDVAWNRLLPDGTREPFAIPATCDVKKDETVTLETTLPSDYTQSSSILFWNGFNNVKIYIDDDLRKEHDLKDSRIIGDASPSTYVVFDFLPADAGKTLTMVYTSNEAGSYSFKTMYRGDKLSIWMSIINENIGAIIIACLAFLLSLISILGSIVLQRRFHETFPIKYLGFGILLLSVWVMSNSSMRQILVPNVSVISDIAFIVLGVIPLAFLYYMNIIQKSRYMVLYRVCACLTFIDFVITNVLVICGVQTYKGMFGVILVMLIAAMLLMFGTMFRDIRTGAIKEYRTTAVSILVYAISGGVQVIGYLFSWEISYNGSIIAIALVFVMINEIYGTLKQLMVISREKDEAVYATKAKAQFLANMSHEIRTPINAVLGMNEMILREGKDKRIQGYAQDIQSAGRSLLALINDILDFSKIESGKMEIIPLEYEVSALLNDSYNLVALRARDKSLEVHIQHEKDTPGRLFGDEIRIRQIIVNLLTNAIKYTEAGTVSLSLGFEKHDPDRGNLLIDVKDTGIGISEEDCQKLFSSFLRVDEARNRSIEGTGLGLSITKQLLWLMGGEISVESEYGKGSVFHVKIPQEIISWEPVGELQNRQHDEKKPLVHRMAFRAPNARALIVDDVKINLKVMKGFMQETEIVIDSVTSGEACLDKMAEQAYDIVFLDYMMPGMDGIETLHRIQKMTDSPNEHTPIIMLTANALSGAREMYIDAGFSDYLSKPFQSEKLEELLLSYLPKAKIVKVDPSLLHSDTDFISGDIESDEEKKDWASELPDIEGIDWKYALLLQPDTESLRNTVQVFHRLIRVDADELNTCYEELGRIIREAGDTAQERGESADERREITGEAFRRYRVKVHSMKSSAALIGAVSLSGIALMLEKAAAQENFETIDAVTPHFLTEWRLYEEKLDCFKPEADPISGEKRLLDKADFLAKLRELDNWMAEMELDEMDAVIQKLGEYELPDEIAGDFERLSAAVLNLDEEQERNAAEKIRLWLGE